MNNRLLGQRHAVQTVRDDDGRRYLLLESSGATRFVRDPRTGERRQFPADELEPVDDESALTTAASAIPDEVRTVLSAVPDQRALGLLLELDGQGPLGVRYVLEEYDLCESDVHGLFAEFRAAGLVTEVDVDGERGYDTTQTVTDALAHLRE